MKPAVVLCQIHGAADIAAHLLKRADLEIITVHEGSHAALLRGGIPHRGLDEFGEPALLDRAVSQAEQRAVAVVRQLYTAAFRTEYAQQYSETAWAALRAKLVESLSRDMAEEILLADLFCRCLAGADVRALVVPEEFTRDLRALVGLANRYGVPSVHLIHGYPYQTQNLHDLFATTRLAVYSEACMRIYVALGANPEHVVVTGNPLWDKYHLPPTPEQRNQSRALLGVAPDRPVIEYILTGPHRFRHISARHPRYHLDLAHEVLEAFFALWRRHPEWQFLLRPHPAQREAAHALRARIDAMAFTACQIDTTPEPEHAVYAADVLLCTHSNMGIEAILQDKPVINVVIDACGGPVFEEGIGGLFSDTHAVVAVRTRLEIVEAVEACMADPCTRAALAARRPDTKAHFNAANDGHATRRFCDVIMDLLAVPQTCRPAVTRFAEFEPVFARLTPSDARRISVTGRGAFHTADAVAHHGHTARTVAVDSLDDLSPGTADAVILADPLASEYGEMLQRAAKCVAPGGAVILGFYNADEPEIARLARCNHLPGAWASTRGALDKTLKQYRLSPEEWAPADGAAEAPFEPMGWAVRCRVEPE